MSAIPLEETTKEPTLTFCALRAAEVAKLAHEEYGVDFNFNHVMHIRDAIYRSIIDARVVAQRASR